jgi:hypothetical protein
VAHLTPLQATFFVTDNSQYRNRIFYFRKDVWQAISKPALGRLISDNFTALEASKFEYSCLRLLPKGANIRPITNMKRRLQVVRLMKQGVPCKSPSYLHLIVS